MSVVLEKPWQLNPRRYTLWCVLCSLIRMSVWRGQKFIMGICRITYNNSESLLTLKTFGRTHSMPIVPTVLIFRAKSTVTQSAHAPWWFLPLQSEQLVWCPMTIFYTGTTWNGDSWWNRRDLKSLCSQMPKCITLQIRCAGVTILKWTTI